MMKHWEIIADNLNKAGWSLGCVSAVDCEGRTIWIADAHRGDGQRFVVHAEEKLTAFMELESAIRVTANWLDKLASFFQTRRRLTDSESGGGHFPPEKLPPPTPDRCEGRLFPPEQSVGWPPNPVIASIFIALLRAPHHLPFGFQK